MLTVCPGLTIGGRAEPNKLERTNASYGSVALHFLIAQGADLRESSLLAEYHWEFWRILLSLAGSYCSSALCAAALHLLPSAWNADQLVFLQMKSDHDVVSRLDQIFVTRWLIMSVSCSFLRHPAIQSRWPSPGRRSQRFVFPFQPPLAQHPQSD